MDKTTLITMLFVVAVPLIAQADAVGPADKNAQDNFGQFVQKAAQDPNREQMLKDGGYKNFGDFVSTKAHEKNEARKAEHDARKEAAHERGDGHRRDRDGEDVSGGDG